LIGVIGKGAAAVVQTPLGLLSEQPYAAAANDGITAVSLPGERWQLAIEVGSALAAWDRLSRIAAPAGQDAWERKGIDAGVPTIAAATSDRFVPQMLNLDLVAGVSFSKGCYPGQEIVARAQYRGQVKRRLERFRIAGPATPGAAIYSEGQEVGTVVNAVADSADHFVALAVVSTTADARTLTLAASGGPALEPLGVPYAVPGAQPSMSDVG